MLTVAAQADYLFDLRLIRHGKVDDEALQFSRPRAPWPSTPLRNR